MGMITKSLNQTAVHWPTTGKDGWGKLIFGTAVEISCRWDEKSELFLDSKGKEVLSNSVLHVDTDMIADDYVYLGTLASLSAAELLDPQEEVNAFPVKAYKKTPGIKADDFVRKVWL